MDALAGEAGIIVPAGAAGTGAIIAGRGAANLFDNHHPIPIFLGGHAKQLLSYIERASHVLLHSILRQNLRNAGIPLNIGGRGGARADWERYMFANPDAQRKAFDAVLNASRQVDELLGTSITQYVWRNIMTGSFKPLP